MKINIDTNKEEIIFEDGEWSEIIDVLKLYPKFKLINQRNLYNTIPLYPQWPYMPFPIIDPNKNWEAPIYFYTGTINT